MDPDQDQKNVGPDLDPNCLQRFSAESPLAGKELISFFCQKKTETIYPPL